MNQKSATTGIKKVSYYVFEKKTETYYNRQGEKKEYKRMAR